MESLFTAWPDVVRRIKSAGHVLLLSDFDGTLTPIVERPELVVLSESIRRCLRLLAGKPRVEVGIISGRSLGDIKARIGIDGITYAGNHGLEVAGPGIAFVHAAAEAARPVLRGLHHELNQAMMRFGGVIVEDKGLTLSVHYRLLKQTKIGDFNAAFRSVVGNAEVARKVRITKGKMVYEIRPAVEWNKGNAIEVLLESSRTKNAKSTLPIFLGDDVTDEDGFLVVEKIGGISIFVGEALQSRSARYFLKSPDEVATFLTQLADILG